MAEFIFETKTVWDGKLVYRRMLLKRGTGSGERGAGSGERRAGSGERGTEVWERVVSGNLHKNIQNGR